MNIGRIKRSIAGRCAAVLTVIMIVVMSFFDSLVYRPMEAYAAAVALPWDSGSFASVVSDLMGAFGGVFGKSLNSATTAIEFGDYVEGRRKEIIANPDATQEEIDAAMAKLFPFAYKDKAGNTKTVEVSGSDVVKTGEFINKLKSTAADTFEIPGSFLRVFQNFLVDKFNFSAVDGSAVSTVYTLPAAQYYDAMLPRAGFPISAYNKSFYLTSDCTVWINTDYRDGVHFIGVSGGKIYKNFTDGSVAIYDFPESESGFSLMKSTFYVNLYNNSYSISIPGWSSDWPSVNDTKISSYKFYLVDYEYVTPSVDVSFADAKAITWTGSADLATTLENQKAAEEAGTLEDYIAKAITAALNPDVPDESESESSGSETGDPDVTLTGVLAWLEKIYNGVIALPKNIASSFSAALAGLGEKIEAIPAALADIGEKIITIPDTIGKEIAKLGDWIQTIPRALADIKDQVVAVPKAIASETAAFFTIDTAQVSASYDGMNAALKGKFSALQQITDLFNKTDYSFSDTPPVITMQTPDILKNAVQSDQIVIMDLTQFADVFQWCRTLLAAMMWVAFGKWVIDQFDVKFHVG